MNRPLLVIAVIVALAAIGLSVYVASHPFIPEDALVERDIQATDGGPLAVTFRFFSWIGDAKGLAVEILIFFGILIFNRRAWIFAGGAALSGGWYEAVSHLIVRARPTTADVLRVTEHPGASSYPSGHTIFIVTVTVVLMLCFGYRFLPQWARVMGWVVVVLIIVANAIARIYTGACDALRYARKASRTAAGWPSRPASTASARRSPASRRRVASMSTSTRRR